MNEIFRELISEIHLPLQNPVLIFSLILFIILLSPIVLKKLNIPGIIGLIISGVIIGPYGLNLLEKNSAIELFSTIGLLYIMFIAGLELNLDDFKSTGNKSLVFGGLNIKEDQLVDLFFVENSNCIDGITYIPWVLEFNRFVKPWSLE